MFAGAAPSFLSRALQLISSVMRASPKREPRPVALQGPGLPGHRGVGQGPRRMRGERWCGAQ